MSLLNLLEPKLQGIECPSLVDFWISRLVDRRANFPFDKHYPVYPASVT